MDPRDMALMYLAQQNQSLPEPEGYRPRNRLEFPEDRGQHRHLLTEMANAEAFPFGVLANLLVGPPRAGYYDPPPRTRLSDSLRALLMRMSRLPVRTR